MCLTPNVSMALCCDDEDIIKMEDAYNQWNKQVN